MLNQFQQTFLLEGKEERRSLQNSKIVIPGFKIVKSFFSHNTSVDTMAMFIEWSAQNDDIGPEANLRPDALPSSLSELVKMFDRFKGKESGPVNHEDFHIYPQRWLKSTLYPTEMCGSA